jgi:hypothetical protein
MAVGEIHVDAQLLGNADREPLTFRRQELPEVTFDLTVQEDFQGILQGPRKLTIRTEPEDDVLSSKLEVIGDGGNLILSRGGQSNVLDGTLNLDPGRYHLFGKLQTSQGTEVDYRHVDLRTSRSRTVTFQSSEPADLHGTLDLPTKRPEGLQVGLRFGTSSLSEGAEDPPFYPSELRTDVGFSGSFRFETVPPGVPFTLDVLVLQEDRKVASTTTIPKINPGETREVYVQSVLP